MSKIYDVVIIGGGPAGLSAGLYAGRAHLDTLIIEKAIEGGQIGQTSEIENYPGSLEGETGPSLVERMAKQARSFGAEIVYDTVDSVDLDGGIKEIKCATNIYQAKTVIIAAGAYPASLGCPGEREFTGKGVSYCATCDGAFFQGLDIYVVGGGDAAVDEALFLTKYAKKVTIIHRRDELRAAKSLQQKAFDNEKIDFMWNTVVKEFKGEGILSSIVVENVKTGEITEIKADEDDEILGAFIFIGFKPQSQIFEGKVAMKDGYIITDEDMKTDVPGVFAAGDIRFKQVRQVITAAAEGAIAAIMAEKYLRG
ncbi:MAG: thioredoxin-disulfide reductase [Clostridiales bacterium]|nr:thioredoxin-disulfide reductase [Clostridiales bacterium]